MSEPGRGRRGSERPSTRTTSTWSRATPPPRDEPRACSGGVVRGAALSVRRVGKPGPETTGLLERAAARPWAGPAGSANLLDRGFGADGRLVRLVGVLELERAQENSKGRHGVVRLAGSGSVSKGLLAKSLVDLCCLLEGVFFCSGPVRPWSRDPALAAQRPRPTRGLREADCEKPRSIPASSARNAWAAPARLGGFCFTPWHRSWRFFPRVRGLACLCGIPRSLSCCSTARAACGRGRHASNPFAALHAYCSGRV